MNTPLDTRLNIAVIHIAGRLFPTGYDICDDKLDTLESLNTRVDETGRMAVWSGASDHTIYDCAETNYAFRAWHDFYHWKHQLPFDAAGERKVLEYQQADIRALYGYSASADAMVTLLEAEILGQLLHQAEFGAFPINQRTFATAYIAGDWRKDAPF